MSLDKLEKITRTEDQELAHTVANYYDRLRRLTSPPDKKWEAMFLTEAERRVKAEEALRQDPLTGLLNRRGVEEMLFILKDKLRRINYNKSEGSEKARIVVMMFDVNGFKQVNDRYGHGVGDELLKRVAEVLRKKFRPDDLIARWGGDEFVVVAVAEQDEVKQWFLGEDTEKGERRGGGRLGSINEALATEQVKVGEGSVKIKDMGVSLAGGISELENDWEAAIVEADGRMYKCKEEMGGGR